MRAPKMTSTHRWSGSACAAGLGFVPAATAAWATGSAARKSRTLAGVLFPSLEAARMLDCWQQPV